MDKKIPIIAGVVVVILLAAALIPYFLRDEEEVPEKVYVDYDSSKGWASWDPEVYIIDSSRLSGSPYLATTARDIVEDFYDVKVKDKYTIKDVPEDFYKYDSLVSHNAKGQLVIKSMAKDTNGVYQPKDIVIEKTPDYYMTTGSFIVTLYYILCEVNGKEYEDFDDKVLTQLWDMVYATDKAGYESDRLTRNYGIPTNKFDGVKLESSTSTADHKEQYISILDAVSAEGKTIMYMASGSMTSWGNGHGTWITEACDEVGSYATLYNISYMSNVLAEIEAIAYIMGYGDYAKDIIDNMKVDLYNTYMFAHEKAAELPYEYCAICTYITGEYTFGYDSIAQEFFDIMGFRNIKSDKSGNWSEENVIKEQPEFLLMVGQPPIDWDALYRVK